MKNFIYKTHAIELLLYFLLSYPLFYYTYKYFSPDLAFKDFFSYYHLYKDFDIKGVDTPFNTRLLSSFLVYVVDKLGIFYNTKIAFNNPDIDQQVYFSAMLISYVSIVFTCFVVYLTCNTYFKSKLYSFLIGVLYLLGSGTLLFCMNPLTDSFSIFLMAVVFKLYVEKSKWIYFVLFMAILQREYIFMVMVVVTIVDFWFERKDFKRQIAITAFSVLCFGIYIALRKTLLYTPQYAGQMEFDKYLGRLLSPEIHLGEYIRQITLFQSILGIYVFILIYKYFKKHTIERKNAWIILLLVLQINIVSLMAMLGNNCGRYFYITTPIILFYIAFELHPLYIKYIKEEGEN